MKALRAISMVCVVLLAGLGIVSAQDSAISTNQPTFSQHTSSAVDQTAAPFRQIGVRRPRSGPPYARTGAPLKLRARHTHKPLVSGTITFTCDPNIDAKVAGTCNYLNATIADDYGSTFTNANANIYIQYGTTGLGSSLQYFNLVPYSQYVAALASNPNPSAIQVAALSALNTYDAAPYGSDSVNVTGALGTALGFTGLTGIATDESACALGTSGCYNAIITITNDPGITLYFDNLGGTEPPDAYDFYTTVEHEADEVLGTSSCVSTQSGGVLTDPCDFAGGTGTPSAVDLFRYNSAAGLALDSSYLGLASAPAGAYFSYNGGTTNGANGRANTPKVYNTLANGDDYADFVSSSPDCGTNQAVQDAEGCPGEDAGLTILSDGGGEINILTAVGYGVPTTAPNFSLSANPNSVTVTQGSSGTSTITITPSNGFTGNVTLAATGLPSGVTALFNPNPATTTSTLTLTASATAATGTVTVTITGTSGSLTNSTTLSLTVNAPQNFSLSASPNSVTVTQGSSVSSTITITPSNGFTGNVTLTASGLPSGVTTHFNPNPATTASTLTLAAYATAATGTFTVTITGTSGSLTNSTTLSLTVNASGGQVIAVPASVNFGNIKIGHTHNVNVKLENVGTTPVVIGSVSLTVTNGDASDFSFHRFCSSPLKAGGSCIIGVRFSPDALGTDTATLNVPTSAPGSPVEVPLTGTGVNKK